MDYCIRVPACAMNRSVGTVRTVFKIRMEQQSCEQGAQVDLEQLSGTAPAHLQSGCEGCKRTRIISKHNSECDSVVDKRRQYSSSTARSRYVNVCAAVCLLVLVGGLSPQSSAAPHLGRNMDRTRRAIDDTIKRLWDNPCDYTDSSSKSEEAANTKELARQLAVLARNTFNTTAEYKEVFTKLHSFEKFEGLVHAWETEDWLRKFPWYREEVLPKEKALLSPLSDEKLKAVMKNIIANKEDVIPAMYKSLKMIVAGLYVYAQQGLNNNIIPDETLKANITKTMHSVRAVLCIFNDIMKANKLDIPVLEESEIPAYNPDDTTRGFFLYRDTLNYLEYLGQVFQEFYESDSA